MNALLTSKPAAAFESHPLHYSIYTRCYIEDVLSMIDIRPGHRLIDVGSGIGYCLERFSQTGAQLVGLEYDPESIRFARKRMTASFFQGSATAIGLRDNSFDVVISNSVLEHVEDDEAVVREMTRICRPGGQLIVSVPSTDGIRSFSRLRNLGHTDPTNPEYHFRVGYTKDELIALLTKHGVAIEKAKYSLVLLSELAMDFLKWVYFRKHKLHSQANIGDATDSPLFAAYKLFLPAILAAEKLDKLLVGEWVRGHIITICGRLPHDHDSRK